MRFLTALKEWEPLRDEAWKLRATMDAPGLNDTQREEALSSWRRSREMAEAPFRRLVAAEQEIMLIAPQPVRTRAIALFVEAALSPRTGPNEEEFLKAVRYDLGADVEPATGKIPGLVDEHD